MSLEDKINQNHQKSAPAFREQLLKPVIVPTASSKGVYYLKDDAKNGLAKRLELDGVIFAREDRSDFANAVYAGINKIPLKQVGYGMLNGTLPKEVAAELTPWEAIYAYAGLWQKKSTNYAPKQFHRGSLEAQTLYQTVRELVINGIERIKYIHNVEARKGTYKHTIDKVPHQDEVMDRFAVPTIMISQLRRDSKMPGQLYLFPETR